MSAEECSGIQFKHGSLKDILEELGKLHNTESTKKNVFQQLKSYLGAYCSASYLDAFYKDYGSGYSYSYGGSIQALTDAGKKISRQILQNPTWADSYSDPHTGHPECIQKYFNALKACLPKAYAALFFLFFNVSNDCTSFGGGSWSSLPVNGSDSENSLGQWLTDQDGSGSDFIARKFSQDELHDSN
ncbi:hypothetical protein X943_000295, partial [Babesia divergens]